MQTRAVEDYLKTIYEIECEQGRVATTVLAERLHVAPASATGMLKKLAETNLVAYERYQGVELTDAGRRIALEVIRHHRLIELYLAETLNVPWDRVHEEAEQLEHGLSEYLEDRIDAMLGSPVADPHGAPIPLRDGSLPPRSDVRLTDLQPDQPAVVAEVSDRDPALLRYVGRLGLYPGTRVLVLAKAPFDGPITVRVADLEQVLGREVASFIWVTVEKPE